MSDELVKGIDMLDRWKQRTKAAEAEVARLTEAGGQIHAKGLAHMRGLQPYLTGNMALEAEDRMVDFDKFCRQALAQEPDNG